MSYPIKRFSTLCRIGGAGYRTLSRLQHTPSPRFSMYTRRGRPLNPYLRGVLIDYLRKEMFPKELKVLFLVKLLRLKMFFQELFFDHGSDNGSPTVDGTT